MFFSFMKKTPVHIAPQPKISVVKVQENLSTFSMTQSATGYPVPLQNTAVNIEFIGTLAHTKITQVYKNRGAKSIEAVYCFPLPLNGILLGMTIKVGTVTMVGAVKPKETASADYEQALSGGNGAFLLRELADGLLQMNLGNLNPDEEAEVTIHYAELLQWSSSMLRYRLPTVIGPHYGDPKKSGIDEIDAPTTHLLVEYPFTATIRFTGDLAKSTITSPTHRILFTKSDGLTQASLDEGAFLDRDLILEVRGTTPAQWESWCAPDQDEYAFLGTLCTPPVETNGRYPNGLTVLLDCSGSMAGDAISQSREALRHIVASLEDGMQFQLVQFGSQADAWFKTPVEITSRVKRQLLSKIDGIDADKGGTELQDAIRRAFLVSGDRADILLITDGDVHVANDEFNFFAEAGHRFFTVGVGSAVSERVVAALAKKSGGACELVTPNECMSERIVAHFLRMKAPKGSATVTLDDMDAPQIIGSRTTIYPGDTSILFGTANTRSEAATVVINYGDAKTVLTANIQTAEGEAAALLPRIVAWMKIKEMDDDKTATDLAVKYQLLTRNTAMVAVLERVASEKSAGLPELIEVAQMLPAGRGGIGSVTATRETLDFCRSGAEDTRTNSNLGESDENNNVPNRRDQYETPSFMCPRPNKGRARVDVFANRGVDKYDIPAFVRCEKNDLVKDPRFHLRLVLRISNELRSSAALREMSWLKFKAIYGTMIPPTVLSDVEKIAATHEISLDKSTLVIAFLHVLAQHFDLVNRVKINLLLNIIAEARDPEINFNSIINDIKTILLVATEHVVK